MNYLDNTVIVFGNNHHNILGLVRSLGEAGCSVDLILTTLDKSSFVSKSRYINKTYYVSDISKGIEVLRNNYKTCQNKPVVFCGNDKVASALYNEYGYLKDYYFLQQLEGPYRIEDLMEKSIISNIAEQCGFTVIPSIRHIRGNSLPPNIEYPCLVKPETSLEGKKSDISVCFGIDDLQLALSHLSENCMTVLLQKYIEKEVEYSVLGVSTDSGVQLPGVICKIREYPKGRGSTSFGCLQEFPDNFDKSPIYRLIDKIKYKGLFSVEYVYKDGIYYFLEINLRNDGNGYVITSAGMNEPLIFCLGMTGTINRYSPSLKLPYYFMSDENDINHVVRREISFSQWFKDYKKTDVFLRYNDKDSAPTKGHFEMAKILVKAIIKRVVFDFNRILFR